MPALAIARANSIKANNIVLRENLYAYIRREEERIKKGKKKKILCKINEYYTIQSFNGLSKLLQS